MARLKGGRVKKAFGGATVSGSGKGPSMGRAGRKRGGGVGADLHPKTHEGGTGPKQRKIMPDSEKVPPVLDFRVTLGRPFVEPAPSLITPGVCL